VNPLLNKIQHIPLWALFAFTHFAHLVWSEWLARTEKVAASTTAELLSRVFRRILKLDPKPLINPSEDIK
jgi:hypothetical protein